ncbi:MAG: hypothetical protein GTN73_03835 [Candidatus Aminicenantes bacterium]|nr:hypothetical protein [Candidatus Aminicenantes bacterium]
MVGLFLATQMAFVSFSCKTETGITGVELEVSFPEATLSDDLITDIQYRWKTKKGFVEVKEDYYAYVHFWHRYNLLFYDNHSPEIPTSKWEPGKEYTYSRRIYIPAFIDKSDPEFRGEGTLRLSIGLNSPYNRSGKLPKPLFGKKLKFLPAPADTPKISYEDGWYDLEISPETALKRWRWAAKEARCKIDNPRQDALLFIKGGVNLGVLNNQKVIFRINDSILDEFIPKGSQFEKSYRIKKDMLGEADKFYLAISTDKTFIPKQVILGSEDERELGVQISFIYFR